MKMDLIPILMYSYLSSYRRFSKDGAPSRPLWAAFLFADIFSVKVNVFDFATHLALAASYCDQMASGIFPVSVLCSKLSPGVPVKQSSEWIHIIFPFPGYS